MNYLIIYLIFLIIVSILYVTWIYKFVDIYSTKTQNFEKRQWVRLLDIFVLGPFAIWLAFKIYVSEELPNWISYLLVTYAIGTIVFNYWNYRKNVILYDTYI
jgi:hypothetical protein